MPLTAPGPPFAQPYGPIEPPGRPGWLRPGAPRGGPFPFGADTGGVPAKPPLPPTPQAPPPPEPLPAVFAPMLSALLDPWMTPALATYVKAIGAIFDGVAALAYPQGNDGDPDFSNLAPNPSFEYDQPFAVPAGWVNTGTQGVPFQVQAGWASSGSQSCRLTATSGAPGWQQSTLMPVTPGKVYSWQASLNLLTVSGNVTPMINWIAGDGSTVLSNSPATVVTTTGLATVSATGLTAPATSAFAQIQISTAAVPFDGYLDAVYFGPGLALPAVYFDGDTVNAGWTGPAGASPSLKPGFIPGWGRLFDVNLCPSFALPFLAQLIGVQIPITVSDAQARALIRAEGGFKRGTLASVSLAIERALTIPVGDLAVNHYSIQERTAADGTVDAYHALINVDPNVVTPVGNFTQLRANVDAAKPIGIQYDVVSLTSPLISQYSRQFSLITATLQAAALADVT